MPTSVASEFGSIDTTRFWKELCSPGSPEERAFGELCNAQFPRQELIGLVFSICTLAVFGDAALSENVFATEIKGLPDDLEALANSVERANKTAFGPGRFSEEPYALAFRFLPGMMRGYAAIYRHIQHQVAPLRRRRISALRLLTIDLLVKVEAYTGRIHSEEISMLLTKGLSIVGPNQKVPKFFHTSTLEKLPRELRKNRRLPIAKQGQSHLPKPPDHLSAGK